MLLLDILLKEWECLDPFLEVIIGYVVNTMQITQLLIFSLLS